MINSADVEKIENCPQMEKLNIYNVLKIAWFAIYDDQKYVYQMLVCDWLFIFVAPVYSYTHGP